jgi:hypothetical protein
LQDTLSPVRNDQVTRRTTRGPKPVVSMRR